MGSLSLPSDFIQSDLAFPGCNFNMYSVPQTVLLGHVSAESRITL